MSHSAPVRRRPPARLLAAIGIAVIVVVLAAFFVFVYWVNYEPEASPTPAASPAASATTTPSATATAEPSAEPSADSSADSSPDPGDDVLSDADVALIEESIGTGAAGEIVDYLADPVRVSVAASDFDQQRSRELAVTDLAKVGDGTGWNWALEPTTLEQFRAGRYADRFPVTALVGESAEGYVVSLKVAEPVISEIFISMSPDALAPSN